MSLSRRPTEREIDAYTVLVDSGPLNDEDVAIAIGADRRDAQELLHSLKCKGFAVRGPGDTFAAAPPYEAMEPVIKGMTSAVLEARMLMEDLGRMYRDNRPGRDDDLIELIEGTEEVVGRADHFMSDAHEDLLALAEEVDITLSPEDGYKSIREAVGRGIDHRVIIKASALQRDDALRRIAANAGPTSSYRTIDAVPCRMMLIDHRLAFVPLPPVDGNGHRAFVLRASPVIRAMYAMFELCWDKSVPLRSVGAAPPPPNGLTSVDLEIVALLVNGMTDIGIAHQLGISARTVQRRIRSLMTRTGATSRVHLGFEAGRRGWLACTEELRRPG